MPSSLCRSLVRFQALATLVSSQHDVPPHPDIRAVLNVTGTNPGGISWADSYSVGDECFCSFSSFDHGIANYFVEIPIGEDASPYWMSVSEICGFLGPGPGIVDGVTPLYNDVQCGNGPPNNAGDEHTCPGRVDIGPQGCGHIGPKWNFDFVIGEGAAQMPPVPDGLHPDIRAVLPDVTGADPGGLSWADSYSVGDDCYCSFSAFDHGIGTYLVEVPGETGLTKWMSVKQVCDMLGPGPGIEDGVTPLYNDVQCGNGPPNNAGDEHTCPGRVDVGRDGCGQLGPKWNLLPGDAETFAPSAMGPATLSPITSSAPIVSPGVAVTGAPLTMTPDTTAAITVVPATEVPLVQDNSTSPTTAAPFTGTPAAEAPVAKETVITRPVTTTPNTAAPITAAPSEIITSVPITKSPSPSGPVSITSAPETDAPTSLQPDTHRPATVTPSLIDTTSTAPVSVDSVTKQPSTGHPATMALLTGGPVSIEPIAMGPVIITPDTIAPGTRAPALLTISPITSDATSGAPMSMGPIAAVPVNLTPVTMEPMMLELLSLNPITRSPETLVPATAVPVTLAPGTAIDITPSPTGPRKSRCCATREDLDALRNNIFDRPADSPEKIDRQQQRWDFISSIFGQN